ncbi:hypothetical protein GUJ93_ZPchr0005g14979 [Zizania palustris]|uniref:Uncharacterized protein n=1 Tax=Zizania palustris TaxID=103762 RepID=A0A8J5SX75_ZIZPA|nr:hypothetical protein GUJ93_ZPchr0005g14979 [Zizania palustris]
MTSTTASTTSGIGTKVSTTGALMVVVTGTSSIWGFNNRVAGASSVGGSDNDNAPLGQWLGRLGGGFRQRGLQRCHIAAMTFKRGMTGWWLRAVGASGGLRRDGGFKRERGLRSKRRGGGFGNFKR